MSRFALRRSSARLLTATVMAIVACSPVTEPAVRSSARLVVHADVSATSIATMVITVSGPGISPDLVFNLPINNGKAEGTLEIPAGSSRKLHFEAFDPNGVKTHDGEKTVATIQPGDNPAVSITLNPIPGQQPVIATLGSYAVTVTGDFTVAVGGTTELAATVKDAEGKVVEGAVVQWATANPAIATVDGSGVVTGVKAGTVEVMATYKGAGGKATITVQ